MLPIDLIEWQELNRLLKIANATFGGTRRTSGSYEGLTGETNSIFLEFEPPIAAVAPDTTHAASRDRLDTGTGAVELLAVRLSDAGLHVIVRSRGTHQAARGRCWPVKVGSITAIEQPLR